MSLLLQCARPEPDPAALHALAAAADDWDAILSDAARHGLSALLYHRLRDGPVPGPVLEKLRHAAHATARTSLRLSAELIRVTDVLERANIAVVPFKGPALAWSLYPSPGLREFSDLDLLVRRRDLPTATAALQAEGYVPTWLPDPRFFNSNREFPLTHPGRQVTVDLHWALAPQGFSLPPEYFLARLAPVRTAGREIRTFAPEPLLLFLCVHGAKHGWSSLNWLCDLALLIHKHALDWDRILADARRLRISRMLHLGLLLASDLVPVPVPIDPRVKALRVRPFSLRFQLALLERRRDKLRLLAGILEPTPADLMSLSIPPRFFPAYYVARPIRLIMKHLYGS